MAIEASSNVVEAFLASSPPVQSTNEAFIDLIVFYSSTYNVLRAMNADTIEVRGILEQLYARFLRLINYAYDPKLFSYLNAQRKWLPDLVDELGEKSLKEILLKFVEAAQTCDKRGLEFIANTLLPMMIEGKVDVNQLNCRQLVSLIGLLLTTPPLEEADNDVE